MVHIVVNRIFNSVCHEQELGASTLHVVVNRNFSCVCVVNRSVNGACRCEQELQQCMSWDFNCVFHCVQELQRCMSRIQTPAKYVVVNNSFNCVWRFEQKLQLCISRTETSTVHAVVNSSFNCVCRCKQHWLVGALSPVIHRGLHEGHCEQEFQLCMLS